MNTARHLLRFALPPPLGALLIALWSATDIERIPDTGTFFVTLGIMVVYGYLFAGAPALAFAVIMALVEKRLPAPRARLSVAALLGAASGFAVGLLFGWRSGALLAPFGLVVGVAVEGLLMLPRARRPRLPSS